MPSPKISIPTPLIDTLLCLCICLAYAGTPAPDVNESHYLTKAKHFWDPSYAAGDLFLESADAHWFFFVTVGWITNIASLPAAAWIGRGVAWTIFAIGWQRIISGLVSKPFLAAASLPAFLCCVDLGQLSGEWIVGGFEAKGIAYGLIFAGIGESFRGKWPRAWLFLGLASAFHVVVGAWVTLTMLIAFAVVHFNFNPFHQEWRKQWIALALGGLCSLPGLVPALLLNRGLSPEVSGQAAFTYVYERLPHHLSPLHFDSERWSNHVIWLVLVGILFVTLGFKSLFPKPASSLNDLIDVDAEEAVRETNEDHGINQKLHTRDRCQALRILWVVASCALFFALLGIAVDFYGKSHPIEAARLLRFYWFRWNDVAWPLAATATLVYVSFSPISGSRIQSWIAILLLLVPSSFWLVDRFLIQYGQAIPEADCLSLLMEYESSDQEWNTYQDWVAACEWIRDETPKNKIWLTPKYQQTFPWYAERAEVVNWKNIPQDATKIVEWSNRMKEVYRYRIDGVGDSARRRLIPNGTATLRRLGEKYQADYALVDRRSYVQLPSLPVIYPTDESPNSTFIVYQLRSDAASVEPTSTIQDPLPTKP